MVRVHRDTRHLSVAVEPDDEHPLDVVAVDGERLHQRDRISGIAHLLGARCGRDRGSRGEEVSRL